MIRTELNKMLHKETSETVKRLMNSVPDVVIENKLEDRLREVGLNQKQISILTGLREGTISDFVNGKKINISKYQLVALMIGLRITDMTDLINVRFPKDVVEQFNEERAIWKEGGIESMPDGLAKHYIDTLEDR